MSALLGAVGAGAGGYAEGRQMRAQQDQEARRTQLAELMSSLQQRSMERELEDAPPEFMQGLRGSVPGFQPIPGANRYEALQTAGLVSRMDENTPGLSYEERLGLINARNKGQLEAKKTPPGRAGDPDLANKQIDELMGQRRSLVAGDEQAMLVMMQTMGPEMAAKMQALPRQTQQIEMLKMLDARIRSYGYDPVTGMPIGKQAPAPAGPQPSPTATPTATKRFNPTTGKLEPIGQ